MANSIMPYFQAKRYWLNWVSIILLHYFYVYEKNGFSVIVIGGN
jgi:hypothetical protein